jgi:hypothetical protein
MSFILHKHRLHVAESISAYSAKITEIETDIRMRAMSNSATAEELRLLQRFKDELSAILYRYQGLNEGFNAAIGETSIAAE